MALNSGRTLWKRVLPPINKIHEESKRKLLEGDIRLIQKRGKAAVVKIDLHIHSTFSDGNLCPSEIIDMAIKKGVSAIAITDHNSVLGNREAVKYSKGKNIKYIPGIEITITPPSICKELHIVGLYIDSNNKEILRLRGKHNRYAKEIIKKIIIKLNNLGYDINFEDLINETKGKHFGRPLLANQLLKKYPNEFVDTKDTFNKLLGKEGKAFVRQKGISMEDAIRIIHEAKGIAIVAHPWYLGDGMEDIIKEFVNLGGDGIERDYVSKKSISADMGLRLDEVIIKYGLVVSGGTDFHDTNKKKKLGDRGLLKEELERLSDYYSKNS